jgi:RNA recognition motif-containing protein
MSDREDFKIYVGNLAYDVTEREVRQHFEKFGDVDEGKLKMASWRRFSNLGKKWSTTLR